jgi:hypothetical protein
VPANWQKHARAITAGNGMQVDLEVSADESQSLIPLVSKAEIS